MRRRAFIVTMFGTAASIALKAAPWAPAVKHVDETIVLDRDLVLRDGDHYERCRFVEGRSPGAAVVVSRGVCDLYFCYNYVEVPMRWEE